MFLLVAVCSSQLKVRRLLYWHVFTRASPFPYALSLLNYTQPERNGNLVILWRRRRVCLVPCVCLHAGERAYLLNVQWMGNASLFTSGGISLSTQHAWNKETWYTSKFSPINTFYWPACGTTGGKKWRQPFGIVFFLLVLILIAI